MNYPSLGRVSLVTASVFLGNFLSVSAASVDFNHQVKPILESACLSCHGPEKPKSKYRMDLPEYIIKGGEKGAAIVPGDPAKSPLYTTTILPKGHDDIMPPKGDPLSKAQTEVLREWIASGAKFPDETGLKQIARVDFVKDIQPILEFNCVSCHKEGHAKGDLRLDNAGDAFKGGSDSGKGIVPFDAEHSSVYTSTAVKEDDDKLMPPKKKNGPLPKDKINMLRNWIAQGAQWPEGLKLEGKKAEDAAGDEVALVKSVYDRVMAKVDVKSEAEMKNYEATIPGSAVKFEMVALKPGEFLMGSPASEAGRKDDEGPQHKVAVDAFWIGKCEVTWNEYELFMYPDDTSKQIGDKADKMIDGISRPTKPYVEMSFGMGKDGFPAISMTQHAANKYCQWLSAKTGQFYRLPTEAEWEYACRAGTTTAYSWGDDPKLAKEYAWFENNSDLKYQKVAKKKPNPWGLHDMHGNVTEWCLDQYEPDYSSFKDAVTKNPYLKQTTPYPQVARGGSWDDSVDRLRSGARRASDKSWKQQDPQLPKSIWYLTDAQFLGFRLVRPLKSPTPDEVNKFWNNGTYAE